MIKYFKYAVIMSVTSVIMLLPKAAEASGRRAETERIRSAEAAGLPHPHMKRERDASPRDWKKIAGKLKLTDEQISAIRGYRDDEVSLRRELRDEERALFIEMKRLISDDSAGEDKIDDLIERSAANHSKMMRLRIDSLINFRNLLTPEQREQLKEMHDARN